MRFPTVVIRPEMLTSWLSLFNYTRSQLAAELGISKGRMSQLLTSGGEPSAHLIGKLMVLTGLPFERLFKVISGNGFAKKALSKKTKEPVLR